MSTSYNQPPINELEGNDVQASNLVNPLSTPSNLIPVEPELMDDTGVAIVGDVESVRKADKDDTNVVAFIQDIKEVFGVDLNTRPLTDLTKRLENIEDALTFFDILVNRQVQLICMGFRKSTLRGPGGGRSGPASYLNTELVGNVRNAQRRNAQSRGSDDIQTNQAINTQTSVIGRKVKIDVQGNTGYYNNGVVIPDNLYTNMRNAVNEAIESKTLIKDIKSKNPDIFKVIEQIHEDVNTFMKNRSARLFHGVTVSFFLSHKNYNWLSNQENANAGSYYGVFSNTDTIAALTTMNRVKGLQNDDGFKNAADSEVFKHFWIKDKEGKHHGDKLLELGGDGEYNRSITLPSGCHLLGLSGSPNPTIQDMMTVLQGEVSHKIIQKQEIKGLPDGVKASGSMLLGAIVLYMADRAGFPVSQYADMELINKVVDHYGLQRIVDPFKSEAQNSSDMHPEIYDASYRVSCQEISLTAAWIMNITAGTLISNIQGVRIAANRPQEGTNKEAFEDLNEDDLYGTSEVEDVNEVPPSSTTTPNITPNA